MMTPTNPDQAPGLPQLQMYGMLNAHALVQALHVAATLGIADLLADGPRTVEELARASQTHAESLFRLLRMLAGAGVFAEEESRCFRLTPLASTLRSDTPDSVRDWAIYIASTPVWTAWGNLLHSVQTGGSAFEHAFGVPLFSYLSDHPDLAAAYNEWMAKQSELQNAAVLASYDFSNHKLIVDVGGGQGATLAAILETAPLVAGVLYDLPQVVARAKLPDTVAPRCAIIAGDLLGSVPNHGDVYVLKRVLMDFNDDLAVLALVNCRHAMAEGGKVLVIEPIVAEGNEPGVSKFLDLTMLALPGGRVRTEAEHRALFEEAGLVVTRMIPTPSPLWLIEGARRS